MATQDSQIIKYDVISAKCSNPKDVAGYNRFLSRNIIRSMVTTENVKSTLNHKLKQPNDIQTLTDYVITKARHVFLALIFSGNLKRIRDLQQHHFTDHDLPVISEPQGSRDHGKKPLQIHTIHRPGQNWRCFSEWKLRKLDDFINRQWAFLAPQFRRNQFNYSFHQLCPLPFVPLEGSNTSEGYFGLVRQVGVAAGHHEIQHPSFHVSNFTYNSQKRDINQLTVAKFGRSCG